MKLVQKNNKIFFQFTLLALLAWAVLFFWVINRIVLNEVDEKLKNNLTRMENRIEAGEPIPHFPPGIEVKKWGSMPTGPEVKILDTLIFDPLEKEKENFRQLTSLYADQIGNVYQITLRASLVETEDLFFALGISLLVLCFILGAPYFGGIKDTPVNFGVLFTNTWIIFGSTILANQTFSILRKARSMNLKNFENLWCN